jgi:SH3-like domain-containing protein
VYCWVCGGTFLEGNEYRNHICVRNPDPSQKPIGTLYVDTANGGNLRMRARPDTNANEVASLKYGTAVSLYSYVNSQWAYVGYRGNYGYCMIRYLSDVAPGLKPTPTPVPSVSQNMYDNFRAADYRVLVNPTVPTGFVNLRWAPSLDAPVQGIYYANSVLRVISTNGTWCQVIDDQKNVCGFMMSAYMKRRAY